MINQWICEVYLTYVFVVTYEFAVYLCEAEFRKYVGEETCECSHEWRGDLYNRMYCMGSRVESKRLCVCMRNTYNIP